METQVIEVLDTTEVRMAGGLVARLAVRQGTNDGALAHALIGTDEYRLAGLSLTGWAIDIGAHIGSITVALALSNPGLRVIAVEPVGPNVEVLRENVARNGLGGRVEVLHAAAAERVGAETVRYDFQGVPASLADPGYIQGSRYIGNMLTEYAGTTEKVPAIDLATLLATYGIDRVALLKIDCEGCEYAFLRSAAIGQVDRIVGEYHDYGAFADLVALLDATHDVTRWTDGPIGLFVAVAR